MEWWEIFKEWFLSLGKKHNVNPYIFGGIYVGAIPFFFLSLFWVIKKIKSKKSVVLPVLLTSFFFVSAYLYLIIVGKKYSHMGVCFHRPNGWLWNLFY